SPLILATLTVIAAILPMAFVRGLMGPYMRPIPIGASAAMVFSMIVAFVATPWAAYKILGYAHRKGKLKGHGHGEKEDFLTRSYRSYMGPLIRRASVRRIFYCVLVLLLFGSVALVPAKRVLLKMLPFDNKNEFQVILNMPEGTPIDRTRAVIEEMAYYVREVPEVSDIEIYVGAAAPYNFNGLVRHYFLRNRPHMADLQVNLEDRHHRKRQSHAIAESIRPKLQEIAKRAGAHVQVAEVPPGPPVLSTLVLEIYGPNQQGQEELSGKIEALLGRTPGITDIDTYVEADQDLVRLQVDSEKASLNGIPMAYVARTVATALKGEVAGLARLPGEYEPVEILVRLPQDKRRDLKGLEGIQLLSRYGQMIPLPDLVKPEKRSQDHSIYHKNLMRTSYVIADVTDQVGSPVYALVGLRKELDKIQLPASDEGQKKLVQYFTRQPDSSREWAVKWDGEWHITYEVFRDLGLAFAAVLILIYALVVGWFKSFKTPVIVMAPIPLSLVGILPAHWLSGVFFTATSMIGLIAGAGIVVRNSIILVDFIELRLKEGMPLEEAVIDAGAVRFRPMLLTASAVVVGASVILFDPIFQGLAIALIAGEVAATILSRTAVPVLYYSMYRKHRCQAPVPGTGA
ncbi:MAG: efflux RND transporter permease subunit, partial [Candidatus Omnitrophica bacterium]|nr:efflux RND transporter permease subunit [Candidatus Omnitrophota bacterium]